MASICHMKLRERVEDINYTSRTFQSVASFYKLVQRLNRGLNLPLIHHVAKQRVIYWMKLCVVSDVVPACPFCPFNVLSSGLTRVQLIVAKSSMSARPRLTQQQQTIWPVLRNAAFLYRCVLSPTCVGLRLQCVFRVCTC